MTKHRSTRLRVAVLAFCLLAALATGITANPASAHGGNGQTSACSVPNSNGGSWGCAKGYVIESTNKITVTAEDMKNDGHCVWVKARHLTSGSWFNTGLTWCSLGSVETKSVTIPVSTYWTELRLTNGHYYATICNSLSSQHTDC